MTLLPQSSGRGNLEEAVHKADLVLHTWLAGEAVPAPLIRMISDPLIVAVAVLIVWKPRVGLMTCFNAP